MVSAAPSPVPSPAAESSSTIVPVPVSPALTVCVVPETVRPTREGLVGLDFGVLDREETVKLCRSLNRAA